MLSEYDALGSGKETSSDLATSGGGGGGGTNPGGGGGGTNSTCGSNAGGGGGAKNAGVGFGATIGGGTGEVFVAPLPALKMAGTLAFSCPAVRTLTDSGGPVVVEILEREPGPVLRVF